MGVEERNFPKLFWMWCSYSDLQGYMLISPQSILVELMFYRCPDTSYVSSLTEFLLQSLKADSFFKEMLSKPSCNCSLEHLICYQILSWLRNRAFNLALCARHHRGFDSVHNRKQNVQHLGMCPWVERDSTRAQRKMRKRQQVPDLSI